MGDPSNSGSNSGAKACADALQSAQNRVRLAFFLNMGACCIVLLIVINLWNSLLVHNELAKGDAGKSEYLAEYSKKIADQSFYQIPSLGIQISCDDIGLLGPLTLLVFSLYSFAALRVSRCHVKSAASHRGDALIDALLEIETLPQDSVIAKWIFQIPRLLLFLPVIVCGVVVVYWVHAHFSYVIQENQVDKVISASRPMAQFLDGSGAFFSVLVLLSNCANFVVAKAKQEDAAKGAKPSPEGGVPPPKDNSSKMAANAPGR